MELKLFSQIGISLLLGLLIGLQRQRAESTIGGIRTFPLIAAFGTTCGWLAVEHGGWAIAAGLVALAALIENLAPAFGAALLTGVAILAFWPASACFPVAYFCATPESVAP